jgi:hypothetical protein
MVLVDLEMVQVHLQTVILEMEVMVDLQGGTVVLEYSFY